MKFVDDPADLSPHGPRLGAAGHGWFWGRSRYWGEKAAVATNPYGFADEVWLVATGLLAHLAARWWLLQSVLKQRCFARLIRPLAQAPDQRCRLPMMQINPLPDAI